MNTLQPSPSIEIKGASLQKIRTHVEMRLIPFLERRLPAGNYTAQIASRERGSVLAPEGVEVHKLLPNGVRLKVDIGNGKAHYPVHLHGNPLRPPEIYDALRAPLPRETVTTITEITRTTVIQQMSGAPVEQSPVRDITPQPAAAEAAPVAAPSPASHERAELDPADPTVRALALHSMREIMTEHGPDLPTTQMTRLLQEQFGGGTDRAEVVRVLRSLRDAGLIEKVEARSKNERTFTITVEGKALMALTPSREEHPVLQKMALLESQARRYREIAPQLSAIGEQIAEKETRISELTAEHERIRRELREVEERYAHLLFRKETLEQEVADACLSEAEKRLEQIKQLLAL